MSDATTLALFLPFISAMLYGLSYALNEKVFTTVSISTYILISSVGGFLAVLLMHLLTPTKIDFTPLLQDKTALWFLLSVCASMSGWLITSFAIKTISANYTAIAEISYPLFTALFGYLIFSRKLGWELALGGLLMMAGSILIVSGKLHGR